MGKGTSRREWNYYEFAGFCAICVSVFFSLILTLSIWWPSSGIGDVAFNIVFSLLSFVVFLFLSVFSIFTWTGVILLAYGWWKQKKSVKR